MVDYRHRLFSAVPTRRLMVMRDGEREAEMPLSPEDRVELDGDTVTITGGNTQ